MKEQQVRTAGLENVGGCSGPNLVPSSGAQRAERNLVSRCENSGRDQLIAEPRGGMADRFEDIRKVIIQICRSARARPIDCGRAQSGDVELIKKGWQQNEFFLVSP